MKKSIVCLSLACVLAFADSTDTNAKDDKESALEKIASSKFVQALASSKISGFAFGRYRVAGGRDARGDTYHWRTVFNVETGRYSGWALGTGVIFTTGAIAADGKNFYSSGGIYGSRGSRLNGANDIFGVNSLYLSKEARKADSFYFKGDIGMLRMNTTFADNSVDRAIGIELRAQSGGISYGLSAYDNWITDGLALNFIGLGYGIQTSALGRGIGNGLYVFEMKLDPKKFGGFHLNFGYGYADKLLDYLIQAEIGYQIAGFSIKAQTIAAGFNDNAHFRGGSVLNAAGNTNLNTVGFVYNSNNAGSVAQHRFVYNVVLAYNGNVDKHSFKAKVGYLGSGLQGYGAALKSNGGLDIGGKSWFNGLTTMNEGFGLFGSGNIRNSDIYVAYLAGSYEYNKKYGIGLDIAYIGGNNYMPLLSKSSATPSPYSTANTTSGRGYGYKTTTSRGVASQDLLEISPSISYKPIAHLTLSAFISFYTLDARWQYYAFEANYKF